MPRIEMPNVVSAIAIIVLTALVHEYEAYLPGDPIYWDMAILALVGYLKSVTSDNDTMEQAFNALEVFRTHIAKRRVRSDSVQEGMVMGEVMPTVEIPERPSKLQKILFD